MGKGCPSRLPAALVRRPVEQVRHQRQRLALLVRQPLAPYRDLAQQDAIACCKSQLDDSLVGLGFGAAHRSAV